MANFDGYGEYEEVDLSSFGGLDRSGPLCGGKNCFELRNMRLTASGKLVRREGYAPLATLNALVRGVYSLSRNDANELYAVAGDQVYFLSLQGQPRLLGSIGTQEGEVHFFRCDRKLLLLDGKGIWVLRPSGIEPIQPYIPLYGKDWGQVDQNTVHEKPSLLCNKVRVRFRPTLVTSTHYMGNLPVISVEQVYVDGVRYERSFSYDADKHQLSLTNGYGPDVVVEAIVTIDESFCGDRMALMGATGVASVGNAEAEKLLFYGGTVPRGSVYVSHPIEYDEYALVERIQPDTCALYLTASDTLTLGDGMCAVTGACRHFDRSLVFTDGMTWMTNGEESENDKLQLIPVNTTMGCSGEGAYTVVGNEPITVMGRRVLRWNSKTDERNECNAEVISREIEPLLNAEFGKRVRVFADAQRGEVWFYMPGKQGRILIRNEHGDSWTSFDGFVPEGMFSFDERIGFFAGQTVFLFDPEAHCDTDEQGRTVGIEAEFMSSFQDFGHSGRVKRPVGATVVASCGNGRAQLVLQHVSGRERTVPLRGDGNEISIMQARIQSGRFRYLRIGFRCCDVREWRVHGIRIKVR